MALGPILGGLISNIFSIRWYYPIMLILIPIILLVFILNRQKLNSAVDQN